MFTNHRTAASAPTTTASNCINDGCQSQSNQPRPMHLRRAASRDCPLRTQTATLRISTPTRAAVPDARITQVSAHRPCVGSRAQPAGDLTARPGKARSNRPGLPRGPHAPASYAAAAYRAPSRGRRERRKPRPRAGAGVALPHGRRWRLPVRTGGGPTASVRKYSSARAHGVLVVNRCRRHVGRCRGCRSIGRGEEGVGG